MIKLLLLGLVCGASSEWAVVTGASSGIGEQLALQAAQRGYDVVLHGRRRGALHRQILILDAQLPTFIWTVPSLMNYFCAGACRLL